MSNLLRIIRFRRTDVAQFGWISAAIAAPPAFDAALFPAMTQETSSVRAAERNPDRTYLRHEQPRVDWLRALTLWEVPYGVAAQQLQAHVFSSPAAQRAHLALRQGPFSVDWITATLPAPPAFDSALIPAVEQLSRSERARQHGPGVATRQYYPDLGWISVPLTPVIPLNPSLWPAIEHTVRSFRAREREIDKTFIRHNQPDFAWVATVPVIVAPIIPLPNTLIFCIDNLLSTATLSSNQTVLKTLANLQNPLRLVKTRLNGVSNVQITVDLGSAQEVQAAILFDTNMTATGTVEVRSSTDNFSSSDTLEGTITIGAQPFQLCHPLFLSNSVSRRYWRFVCNDASNPDGYIEWGVGYLGTVTSLGRTFASDVQVSVLDPSRLVRSPAGLPLVGPGVIRRSFAFTVPAVAEATAWQTVLDLLMQVGASTDLFVCLWPQHSDTDQLKRGTLYGAFTQLGALAPRATLARSVDLRLITIEES